ncbi:MAG TPA: TIGR03013 family PEP-CTERM/XrtA system glycosyltransferase [Rubrivivax sp.]|nr:TIGR03013 family PEP-CTERM/XrtA system glycosyltransferase [Rubrivivax sp.]
MSRTVSDALRRLSMARAFVDVTVVLLAVYAGVLLDARTAGASLPALGTRGVSLAAGIVFLNVATGLYDGAGRRSLAWASLRALAALAVALPLAYFVFRLRPAGLAGVGMIQWAAMTGVAAVILHRGYEATTSAVQARTRRRTLIFGSGEAARVVAETLRTSDPGADIVGFYAGPNEGQPAVPPGELLPATQSLLETAVERRVDEIVVALAERRAGSMPLRELLDCKLRGIGVYDINSHFEKRLGQIRIGYLHASWMIFGDGFNQGLARTAVKRLFDIVCSLALLALAAPVMLLAALAIRLDSRGSALYRQERTGKDGRAFEIIKFRSMRTDAESDGRPRWAAADDDRVTRVGRFIRRTRIDELPQLLCVLKGDMSLVGPRPERPFFVEQLTREIPFYAVRHSVKPGVTGWAQVRYQYGSTVEDSQQKLQYDLYYVKNHSLWLDLQTLVETVHVVLSGQGAR